jgi:two-component system, chemotaxis family, protein-glutamate methylesterase/glutaminase
MDGFEATRRIMESNPVPIVIVSASWNPEEVDKTFRTMEAGAVAALEKPRGMGHPNSESSVKELLQTVKLMSEVKVVRRWSKYKTAKGGASDATSGPVEPSVRAKADTQLVAIGASTGGPMVLQTILSALPKDFPLPVVIVQHIALGFLAGLRDWLGRSASMPVHVAEDKQQLMNGHVYLAPDGFQMGVDRFKKVVLQKDVHDYTLCPSVSYLFKSVGESFGDRAIAVLLTGMGRDGAEEMKLMKDKGALTVAQDRESSVVHGMPGEAIRLGGATLILPPEKIASKLVELASGTRREGK